MKIKDGYVLRSVANQHIVMPVGEAAIDFNGLIRLNESGKRLYEALVEGTDEDGLVALLLEHYDVDETVAKADVKAFLDALRSKDVLVEDA